MNEALRHSIIAAIEGQIFDEAERLCRQAGAEDGQALYLGAVLRQRQGRGAEAVDLITLASARCPQDPEIAFCHGNLLIERRALDGAVEQWRRTLTLAPDHQGACYNLARALTDSHDLAGAAEQYGRLLALAPDHKDGLYNLGNVLSRLNAWEQALPIYARLLQLYPDFADGWVNFGLVMRAQGRDNDAEFFYRTALGLAPDSVLGHYNLGMLLLAGGRWDDGWAAFEWRLRLADAPKPNWPFPLWRTSDPPGRRVLVWNDQGRGDAVHFLRYAATLAERGARVFAFVQDDLVRLAAAVPGVEQAIGFSQPPPGIDAHAPLLSLPHLLRQLEPAGSWRGPYLPVEPNNTAGRRRVGLVWAGNPGHANDANRSMRLETLAPLLEMSGMDWVSLQVGPAAAQCHGWPIRDVAPRLTDFHDTAAVIADLDLVISVDTAVAHLAGAMGKPVWVLLPRIGLDWRWGKESETTPWYPSMRLFRQRDAGQWAPVVDSVRAALTKRTG